MSGDVKHTCEEAGSRGGKEYDCRGNLIWEGQAPQSMPFAILCLELLISLPTERSQCLKCVSVNPSCSIPSVLVDFCKWSCIFPADEIVYRHESCLVSAKCQSAQAAVP